MGTKSKENICSKLSAIIYSEALARHDLWLRANLGKLTRLCLGKPGLQQMAPQSVYGHGLQGEMPIHSAAGFRCNFSQVVKYFAT